MKGKTGLNLLGAALMLALFPSPGKAATELGPWVRGDLVVEQAWMREVPNGASTAALYLTIHNRSDTNDVLMAVTTKAARHTTIHESRTENGVARMVPVPGGLTLRSHEDIVMQPGSFHVMMTDLTERPKPGTVVTVQLVFATAGEIELEIPVLPITAVAPPVTHVEDRS